MEELKGEQLVLKEMLNSSSLSEKTEALKRVVIAMTIGKPVGSLFQHVIKCLELPNLETKKIVYLYIINNSRTCPDDALMIVNQFCKDARDKRPLIRALAIRTMGYLRVAKLNEYLIDPLLESLRDTNPYVRKTAVNCIPKVMEVSRELIEAKDIQALLRDVVETDTNPSVVAAALLSEKEINSIQGKATPVPPRLLLRVLGFCDSFSDFETIYVFEMLADYATFPGDLNATDRQLLTEALTDRVAPKLSHCNKALVMAASKALIRLSEVLQNAEADRAKLLAKIAKSLHSLMNRDEETSLVVAQTFLVLDRKFPEGKLLRDPSVFFCRSEDSLSLKVLKLKLIRKSTTAATSLAVFDEMVSYFKSPDLAFSKKAVRGAFRVARDLPTKATFSSFSQKIGEMGIHFAKTGNMAILEEIFAGFADLLFAFTKSISRKELLGLFKGEKTLANLVQTVAESKADFVSEKGTLGLLGLLSFLPITNEKESGAVSLPKGSAFYRICDAFFRESEEVQLAVIGVLVRLYLLEIDESDALLTAIFERIGSECRSVLVKDQAYTYWRLLTNFPDEAKAMLFDGDLLAQGDTDNDQDLLGEEGATDKNHGPDNAIDTRSIGTFLSHFAARKTDGKLPLFLQSDTFQFRHKGKEKLGRMNLFEKRLLYEKDRPGKRGRNGCEITGGIESRQGGFTLALDVKNLSNLVHEITDLRIAPNHAGFELDPTAVAAIRSRCIQKNEICMLEVPLLHNRDAKVPLDTPLTALTLECSLETNLDVYEFRIPYPFSLLLAENTEPIEDEKLESLLASNRVTPERFSLESYEENLGRFAKIFEANRVQRTRAGGAYVLRLGDSVAAAFRLDKKMDSDVEVVLHVLDRNTAELSRALVAFLINLV